MTPTVFRIINNVLRGVDLHIHENLDHLVPKEDIKKFNVLNAHQFNKKRSGLIV